MTDRINALEAIIRPAFCAGDADWQPVIEAARARVAGHGDLARWQKALSGLPDLSAGRLEIGSRVAAQGNAPAADLERLHTSLRELHPWRKGPFDLFGIHLDTEWRSDWKWDRVAGALGNLEHQQVLDVGCGNGYFGWRLLGAGAAGVLGVDPTVLFFLQHLVVCRYLGTVRPNPNGAQSANFLLPVPFEILPPHPFDLVLSMGVVYHRPDPAEHVRGLHAMTRPGGRVLLESLVVEDGPDLHPASATDGERGLVGGQGRGRYARMRNVHVVPNLTTLAGWLTAAGFTEITTVDVSPTGRDEQRSTPWMTFESLAECLDPDDPGRTVEGYPAPVRAALIAHRPS